MAKIKQYEVMEEIVSRGLEKLPGLEQAVTDAERNRIYDDHISKSFKAFVQENGSPFGTPLPPNDESKKLSSNLPNAIPSVVLITF